ncbi:hypothetical protein Vadar_034071 [Vaccinium darrowii]|uniref:Uncharacterized protein n=1 Tax=Vaccinium darrowii TaxID=229202 RepID=A0ACB7X6D4_9ERIC|nr:hypothetical protein Vadar_034071 [Vaccinium darrowii]
MAGDPKEAREEKVVWRRMTVKEFSDSFAEKDNKQEKVLPLAVRLSSAAPFRLLLAVRSSPAKLHLSSEVSSPLLLYGASSFDVCSPPPIIVSGTLLGDLLPIAVSPSLRICSRPFNIYQSPMAFFRGQQHFRTQISTGFPSSSARGGGLHTVYIDNLPNGVGLPWFRKFFSNFGSVKDAYLPIKRSKRTGNRFGFIRFDSIIGADCAMEYANGFWIGKRHLIVEKAAYDKVAFSHSPHPSVGLEMKGIGGSRSFIQAGVHDCRAGVTRKNETKNERRLSLNLQPVAVEWLTRSAVAILKELTTPEIVLNALRDLKFEEVSVKSLGGLKLIITFQSRVDRAGALRNPIIVNWFSSFKPWNGEVAGESRIVWLKCRGMPLTVWNVASFKRLAEFWGNFITLDVETMKEESYDVRRVLLATEQPQKIEEWINIIVGGKIHKVKVWEEDCVDIFIEKPISDWVNKQLIVSMDQANPDINKAEKTSVESHSKEDKSDKANNLGLVVGHASNSPMAAGWNLEVTVEENEESIVGEEDVESIVVETPLMGCINRESGDRIVNVESKKVEADANKNFLMDLNGKGSMHALEDQLSHTQMAVELQFGDTNEVIARSCGFMEANEGNNEFISNSLHGLDSLVGLNSLVMESSAQSFQGRIVTEVECYSHKLVKDLDGVEESPAIDCDDVDESKEVVANSLVDMADPIEVLEDDDDSIDLFSADPLIKLDQEEKIAKQRGAVIDTKDLPSSVDRDQGRETSDGLQKKLDSVQLIVKKLDGEIQELDEGIEELEKKKMELMKTHEEIRAGSEI